MVPGLTVRDSNGKSFVVMIAAETEQNERGATLAESRWHCEPSKQGWILLHKCWRASEVGLLILDAVVLTWSLA
jgi:hypothetical protein